MTLFHVSLLGVGNTNIDVLTIPVHQLNLNQIFRSVETASNEIRPDFFFLIIFGQIMPVLRSSATYTYKNLEKCNQHPLILSCENQYGIYKV